MRKISKAEDSRRGGDPQMWKEQPTRNLSKVEDCRQGGDLLTLMLLLGVSLNYDPNKNYHLNAGLIVENLEKIVVFGKVR